MDNLKRIDTKLIYPKFLKLVEKVLEECNAKNYIYIATSGTRTVEQQDRLYAQGRTMPGNIVTKAKGGESAHNFGLALDFARDKDSVKFGLQPGYSDDDLKLLADTAVKLGLEAGFYWKTIHDSPHIQVNLKAYGVKLSDLLKIYNQNKKLQEVWDFLDTKIK